MKETDLLRMRQWRCKTRKTETNQQRNESRVVRQTGEWGGGGKTMQDKERHRKDRDRDRLCYATLRYAIPAYRDTCLKTATKRKMCLYK